ncbi:MAG: hypothetical protein APR54_03200 [Candidatus Cloacimonas sp. SDB]|nr:MAG: hypothetical protein APR54_03200 [Candidatus Cloacimonas sp. SDB]
MNLKELVFRQIEYDSPEYHQAVKLRSKVLREPLNMRFTETQLRAEKSYLHIAGFRKGKIVCCLYLIKEAERARLKQFAVEPELQKKGIGSEMLRFLESYCRKQGFSSIYMHAREKAVPFYEKFGYECYDQKFLEIGLPHRKLRKVLAQHE